MAGSSVTFTKVNYGEITRIKAVWVSDSAAGTASGVTTFETIGQPIQWVTVPDGGGTQPSAYSVTLKDQNGLDILNGKGATRSTTATEAVKQPDLLTIVATSLTLAITGAGNSKGGTAYLDVINLVQQPV